MHWGPSGEGSKVKVAMVVRPACNPIPAISGKRRDERREKRAGRGQEHMRKKNTHTHVRGGMRFFLGGRAVFNIKETLSRAVERLMFLE